MLLETATWHNPGIEILSLEYRARNPIIVNEACTINGKWTDAKTLQTWCVNELGVVGMTGTVRVA
jgi:hydroxyacyl-ACP dehydratase HTD2-like protein with hotdog domain